MKLPESVLIKTFSEFAEWLETAAIAPANKNSFWSRLFGKKPTRPAFDKGQSKALSANLRTSVVELRDLLFSEDEVTVEVKQSTKKTEKDGSKDEASVGVSGAKLGLTNEAGSGSEASLEQTEKYTKTKLQHLHRHILDYQNLFRRMATLFGGDAFLFLDDLYHIRLRDQAQVIDYFHRIGKGNQLWIEIGTIRHRTQWYINGDPPIGGRSATTSARLT